MKKPISFLIATCLFLLLNLSSSGLGKTSIENIESKIKKIFMMLSIAAKESGLEVENGAVINMRE